MDGTRNSFSHMVKRAKKSAIVSSNHTDLFKALAKSGRACSNSMASRKANGVDTHQIRTKTTSRANTNKGRRKCCTVLQLYTEERGSWPRGLPYLVHKQIQQSTALKSRESWESHSRSTRLLVEALIFNTRGIDFSGCHPTMKVSIWDDHGSNMFWRVEQFASHGTLRNSPSSMSAENHAPRSHTEPSSIFNSSS